MVNLFEVLIGMGFTITVGARGEDPLLPDVWIEIVDYKGNAVFLSVDRDENCWLSFTPLIKEECECS